MNEFRTYQEALDFVYSQLPMFHREGAAAYKSDLGNITALLDAMGHPEKDFPTIHVAGTNGKGSSSHMLASILCQHGYRVGLHTSPHLKDPMERIVVEGKKAFKHTLLHFLNDYKELIERVKPSFFEMMVAMAFRYFSNQRLSIAVIETGLGGRLDSTNVISPIVSLITNISYDHTQLLGDTLEKIAIEKAGIIKPNTPVVISEVQPEIKHVFIEKAKQMNAPIYFANEHFEARNCRQEDDFQVMDIYKDGELYIESLRLSLLGHYQRNNVLGVLQAIEALNETGYFRTKITKEDMALGLERINRYFPLKGRWQTIDHNPRVLCDTGHNEAGIKFIVDQLAKEKYKELHFIFGAVQDKDIDAEIALLPKDAEYYICKPNVPRGLPVEVLANKMKAAGLQYTSCTSVQDALRQARLMTSKDDLIFIGGSTFVVAEVL